MQVDMQDGDILGRARAGDERAFLALYRAAQPGLLRYLSVIAGDAAHDITADAWSQVARELGSFVGTLDDFRTWVAGIGRRHALDHLATSAAPVRPLDLDDDSRMDGALRMIGDLPREEAESVALRSVVGIDEASAAQVLGVRRATVRWAALRGLRALGRRLESAGARGGAASADETLHEPPARVVRVIPQPVPRISIDLAAVEAADHGAGWPSAPGPKVVVHDLTGARWASVPR